ncbi:hypothetical protein NTGBS_200089 [Candidatus Nitrotoga sp. BS]|nr:hypothetical protein NTGBS_200089 [Candidatus Nitrotoga sp. BS]
MVRSSRLLSNLKELAGLPALQGGEPGQIRKEAAITITASAGGKARLLIRSWSDNEKDLCTDRFDIVKWKCVGHRWCFRRDWKWR